MANEVEQPENGAGLVHIIDYLLAVLFCIRGIQPGTNVYSWGRLGVSHFVRIVLASFQGRRVILTQFW